MNLACLLAFVALIAGAVGLERWLELAPRRPAVPAMATILPATAQPSTPAAPLAATDTAVPAPDDRNYLLLGSDGRKEGDSWRTDTIIVVAVRPQAGFVAMFSIPRDLWVTIPGYGEERINTADYRGEITGERGGGPALVAATLQQTLDIPIHGYARIDFGGLVRVIDALGGIEVTVERALPNDGIAAGTQHMDGTTALAYARNRTYASDLDRTMRQQDLLLALREAALRPAMLPRLPWLVASLPGVVETDVSPAQALSLATMALRLEPGSFRTRVFDYSMVRDWTTPAGAMVLIPDWARIRQAWAELTAP